MSSILKISFFPGLDFHKSTDPFPLGTASLYSAAILKSLGYDSQ